MTMLRITLAVLALSFFSAPAVGASCGFYAHKNSVHQIGMMNGRYTPVTFSDTHFDNCESFDAASAAWHPPAGVVHLSAQIYWIANASPTPLRGFVVKIFKNGTTDVCTGIGHLVPQPGVAVALASCDDLANGTDFYQVEAYGDSADGADDLVVDGNPSHTFFSGSN